MKRTRLEAERIRVGLSKAKLARQADVNPAVITWAEQRGFQLYPVQLERIASALGWEGDPNALLETMGDD